MWEGQGQGGDIYCEDGTSSVPTGCVHSNPTSLGAYTIYLSGYSEKTNLFYNTTWNH